jgi:hypothetical protein
MRRSTSFRRSGPIWSGQEEVAMAIQVAKADDLSEKICRALGLDPNMVARLIIDLQVHEPVMVHVQLVGSPKLLEIDWGALIESTGGIRVVDAPAPVIPPYNPATGEPE